MFAPRRPHAPPKPTFEELARWSALLVAAEAYAEKLDIWRRALSPPPIVPPLDAKLPDFGRVMTVRKRCRRCVMPASQQRRDSALFRLLARLDEWSAWTLERRVAGVAELASLIVQAKAAFGAPAEVE